MSAKYFFDSTKSENTRVLIPTEVARDSGMISPGIPI